MNFFKHLIKIGLYIIFSIFVAILFIFILFGFAYFIAKAPWYLQVIVYLLCSWVFIGWLTYENYKNKNN